MLFVIPHYYGPPALGTAHGSSTVHAARRAAILRRTVISLHQHFGTAQCMMQLARRRTDAANQNLREPVRVVVSTVAERHLLTQAALPPHTYAHRVCRVPPPELGFACHQILREEFAADDSPHHWFGYLEDDLLVHDPLLFAKLRYFLDAAGPEALLLPNRFERDERAFVSKAYVDGDLPSHTTAAFQKLDDRPELVVEALGQPLRFVRPSNPHAGCFFLHRSQMPHWIAHSRCAQPSSEFIGPLESAASLSTMCVFRVYKPALEQAAFLEIEHQSRQFVSQLRTP